MYRNIVRNAKVTSDYGKRIHPITKKEQFHQGVDLVSTTKDLNIYAPYNSKVVKVALSGSYGNYIILQHNFGLLTYETLYAHLASVNVKEGTFIPGGSIIGKMGTTGSSTGVHLHLELHRGEYVYQSGLFPNKMNPKELDKIEPLSGTIYLGPSLVDYLKSIGVDSSISNRRKIARLHGMNEYSGLASQNSKLLKLLRGF